MPDDADSRPHFVEHACVVRRETDSAASAIAVAILLEAAGWAQSRGTPVWSDADLPQAEFAAAAAAGELVLGYVGEEPAATMLLQPVDNRYWADARPGSALYLHKVAVRRPFAAQGWLPRLIDFAARDARRRGIERLRLDTLAVAKLQSLYEACGFKVLVEEPLLIGGRRIIRMERPA